MNMRSPLLVKPIREPDRIADYIATRELQAPSRHSQLSARELEIARLAGEGLSNKEIALVLQISPHTVATHLRRIYGKLGLHCRAQLAVQMFAGTAAD